MDKVMPCPVYEYIGYSESCGSLEGSGRVKYLYETPRINLMFGN